MIELGTIIVIFGSISLWVWMSHVSSIEKQKLKHNAGRDGQLEARMGKLEQELEQLKKHQTALEALLHDEQRLLDRKLSAILPETEHTEGERVSNEGEGESLKLEASQ